MVNPGSSLDHEIDVLLFVIQFTIPECLNMGCPGTRNEEKTVGNTWIPIFADSSWLAVGNKPGVGLTERRAWQRSMGSSALDADSAANVFPMLRAWFELSSGLMVRCKVSGW